MAAVEYVERWMTGPGDTNFYTNVYIPAQQQPKAVVVAVHGFLEHIGRFTHVFSRFKQRGLLVFAYDQRGFGRTALDTTGKRSKHSAYGKFSGPEQLADLEFFLRHAQGLAPAATPMFLLGHSMGGAEVISFVLNAESPIVAGREALIAGLAGVVASAPLIGQSRPMRKAQRERVEAAAHDSPWVNFPTPVNPANLCRDRKIGEAFVNDPLVVQEASLRGLRDILNRADDILGSHYGKWPVQLPIFIVHGDNDKINAYSAAKTFYDKLKVNDKTFTTYENGYHDLVQEPADQDKVIEEWLSWIERRVERDASTGYKQTVSKL